MLLPDIDEVLAQYSPEQLEKAQEDWAWVTKRWLPKTLKTRPQLVQQLLEDVPSEELLSVIKPEKRQAMLKLLLEEQKTNKPEDEK